MSLAIDHKAVGYMAAGPLVATCSCSDLAIVRKRLAAGRRHLAADCMLLVADHKLLVASRMVVGRCQVANRMY